MSRLVNLAIIHLILNSMGAKKAFWDDTSGMGHKIPLDLSLLKMANLSRIDSNMLHYSHQQHAFLHICLNQVQ